MTCCSDPPDVHLAVGPSQVVQVVNTHIRMYTKSGSVLSSTELGTFFGADSTWFFTDPRVLYDATSGRFFLTVAGSEGDPTTATTGLLWVAVSTSSDPTEVWKAWLYTFSGSFPDYPASGVSDDKFAVAATAFALPGPGSFLGAEKVVFNKSQLVSGAASPSIAFAAPDPNYETVQPAQSLSSTSTLYLASVNSGTSSAPSSTISFWTITGVPGVSTVSESVTPLSFGGVSVPPNAAQPSPGPLLDTGDNRLQQAVWRSGTLWTAGNTRCTPTGDTTARSCAYYVAISTVSMPSVQQSMSLGAPGAYYFYPALQIDGSGIVTTVFGRSSSSEAASLRYTGRYPTDGLSTLQSSSLLKSGNGAYCSLCGAPARYGDYFGAAVDPSDTSLTWISGEYAKVTTAPPCTGCVASDQWGTYIARISWPSATPTPTPTASPTPSPTPTPTPSPTPVPTAVQTTPPPTKNPCAVGGDASICRSPAPPTATTTPSPTAGPCYAGSDAVSCRTPGPTTSPGATPRQD